jgi:hypothetical protein
MFYSDLMIKCRNRHNFYRWYIYWQGFIIELCEGRRVLQKFSSPYFSLPVNPEECWETSNLYSCLSNAFTLHFSSKQCCVQELVHTFHYVRVSVVNHLFLLSPFPRCDVEVELSCTGVAKWDAVLCEHLFKDKWSLCFTSIIQFLIVVTRDVLP